MVIFAELLKGVRKDMVLKTYQKALIDKGYDTSSFKYIHLLEKDGYRTMVMMFDVPITEANKVIQIGCRSLGTLCNNVVPDFRMIVEFKRVVIEETSATDLYRLADLHNSNKVWDNETNISKDYMFVKRVHSTNKNVAFSVVIRNITNELYLTKYKAIIEDLLKLKGAVRVIVA